MFSDNGSGSRDNYLLFRLSQQRRGSDVVYTNGKSLIANEARAEFGQAIHARPGSLRESGARDGGHATRTSVHCIPVIRTPDGDFCKGFT
jgi:hypothetical protein